MARLDRHGVDRTSAGVAVSDVTIRATGEDCVF
jgi:hypothetical protein